jgi:hypothetical protein
MQFFPNVSTVVPHVFAKRYWATQGQPKKKKWFLVVTTGGLSEKI